LFLFFLLSKTKRSIVLSSSQNKRKITTSIFSTQRRFFHRCSCRQRSHHCFTGQTISQSFWLCWPQHCQSGLHQGLVASYDLWPGNGTGLFLWK